MTTRPVAMPALPADPASASKSLLALDEKAAARLFQRLPMPEQLAILNATPNPKDRETIFYLVPDCAPLIQESPVENLLEIINLYFGSGGTVGILASLTGYQFAEMFERTVWLDGKPDPNVVSLWIAELSELDSEEITTLLMQLDIELIAELLRNRLDLPTQYKGMLLASGIFELENAEFSDEQTRLLGELLWAADPERFIQALRFVLTEDDTDEFDEREYLEEEESTEETEETQKKAGESETREADWLTNLDPNRLDDVLPPVKNRH